MADTNENEQTLALKVGTVALTFAAGWAAQKLVTFVWAKVTGHDAPNQHPANPADAEALQMLQQRVDDLERQVAALTERLERLES